MSGPDAKVLTLGELKSNEYASELYHEMDFSKYFEFAQQNPYVAYSAYQRMYQSIIYHGHQKFRFARRDYIHYNFFDDPFSNEQDAVFGLDRQMMRLVEILKAGAAHLGQERRFILLHGPVGSSKSTIARLLRNGLQRFTKTDEGRVYTYSWVPLDDEDREIFGLSNSTLKELKCPLHENPLTLLPHDTRAKVVSVMNNVQVRENFSGKIRDRLPEESVVLEGDSCPLCRLVYKELLRKYKGDWMGVLTKHLKVRRLVFSEVDRIGIGSFRPKDEKNQDSTELSGDINYRKIAEFGSESDPRAFNFDGEFEVSYGGFFYVEEVIKLDKAFLYDFLGATQEHRIKPKRFPEIYVDCVYMGGTNNPEYEKLRDDETMEAFRDRTTRVDVPYVLQLSKEEKIYKKIYKEVPGQKHIAPHTIEMASMWALLTRIKESKRPQTQNISLRNKIRLYDGQTVSGFTEEHVHDLMYENPDEGMKGISPRYIQDQIGNAIVEDTDRHCVSWFAVKKELDEGLSHHSLLKGNDRMDEFRNLLSEVEEEFTEIVKGEVQEAIASDEKDIQIIFNKYIENVIASINEEKIEDHRKELVEPDEKLMREVEEKSGVSEGEKKEFRARLVQSMGTLSRRGKQFDFKTDEKLYKGLKLKLFEDRKDTINLSTLHTRVVDPEEQAKIEIVKKRLIDRFGYCNICATLVMSHVASIFASGTKSK